MLIRSTPLIVAMLAATTAIATPPKVGAPPPPLTLDGLLQAPEGTDLSSWEVLRGQVVVLEFWGTWCGPCVAAIPHLNELAEHFADDPVRFVSVTFESADVIEPFLEKKPMQSWIGLDTDRSTVRDYGVSGWPTTFLIDAEGRLAAVTYPTAVTETVLRNLLDGREPGLMMADGREAVRATTDAVAEADEAEALPTLFELRIRASAGTRAGMTMGSTKIEYIGQPLRTILGGLYDVLPTRMSFEADLPGERMDVKVTPPDGDLQRGLELLRMNLERVFGYRAVRREVEREVYVMTAVEERGKGLTRTAMEGGSSSSFGQGFMNMVNTDAAGIAGGLEMMLQTPVVDETGLEGRWDCYFKADDFTDEAIIAAVRTQLGLMLEKAEREVEVLAIEAREQ